MKFKIDKDTAIIVAIGCALITAWALYLPKYQEKRNAEYQKMLRETQQTQAQQQMQQPAGTPAQQQQAVIQPAVQNPQPAVKPADNAEPLPETKLATLENELARVQIDALTGAISSTKLIDHHFKLNGSEESIELFRDGAYRTYAIRTTPALRVVKLDAKNLSPDTAEIVREFSNGLKLVQTFTLSKGDYIVECGYEWSNPTAQDIKIDAFGVRLAGLPPVKNLTGDDVYSERMNVDFCRESSGMCNSVDPQVKSQEKFDRQTANNEPTSWVSSTNKYFASMLFASDDKPFISSFGERVWLFPAGSTDEKERFAVPSMVGEYGAFTVPAEGKSPVSFHLRSYAGPKEMSRIRSLSDLYPSVMGIMHVSYYSWFEFIARPMVMLLNWLKGICGSFGLAIILLTIIVRVLFWPVTQKANSSMRRMQKLQPKIKELQAKYKEGPMDTADDTARKKAEMNQKMMEMYRQEKVNPLGGCLPVLLQIPVFIALYSALDSAVELRHVSFLWCTDLSRPDLIGPTLPFALPFLGKIGFHPLVLLMTALMVLQQKMTPTTGDSTQQKMMMIMPIMMLFMFYNLPSGLTLYWTVSQIFSILQMKYGQIAAKREEARQAKPPLKA